MLKSWPVRGSPWKSIIIGSVAPLLIVGIASWKWGWNPVAATVSAIGELRIAFVIYLEIEGAQLDHFYNSAFDRRHWRSRRKIYEAYCSTSKGFLDVLRVDDICGTFARDI